MDNTPASRKQAVLLNLRQQVAELYTLVRDEGQARERKWSEEQPMLEAFIAALTQTRELLRKEKKDITEQLAALRAKWEKEASKYKKSDRAELTDESVEVDDLQKKLIDLNNRELDVKFELEKLKQQFEGTLKEDERQIYETKLVVLQDTRRILLEEINELRGEIFRRETSTKYESECRTAETSGWEDLGRLEEQLARLDSKIDRAKQQMHFPAAKGYRFSGGSSGVYFAAKELYVSELSGSFQLRCCPVEKSDGTTAVQLFVSLGGASSAQAAETPVALARIHRRSCSHDVKASDAKQQANGSPIARAVSDSTQFGGCRRSPSFKSPAGPDASVFNGSDDEASSMDRSSSSPYPAPLPTTSSSPVVSSQEAPDPSNGSRSYRGHVTSIINAFEKSKDRLKDAVSPAGNNVTPSRESPKASTPPGPLPSSASSPSTPLVKPPQVNVPRLQVPLAQPVDINSARGKFMGFAKKMSQTVVSRGQTLSEKVAARSQTLSQTLGEKVVATSHTLSEKMAAQKQTIGEKMAPMVNRGQILGQNLGQNLGEKMGQALGNRRVASMLQRRSFSQDEGQLAPLASGLSGLDVSSRGSANGDSVSQAGYDGASSLQDVDLLDSPVAGSNPVPSSINTPEPGSSVIIHPDSAADGLSISGRDDLSEVTSSVDNFSTLHSGHMSTSENNTQLPSELRVNTSLPSSRLGADDPYDRGSPIEMRVSELSDILSTGERSDDGFENIPLSNADGALSPPGGSPTALQRNLSPLSASSLGTGTLAGERGVNSEVAVGEAESEGDRGETNGKGTAPATWAEEGQHASRKGLHVTLLSENVEVVGEKGSKMPNISARELALEVEVMLQATFEYNPMMGWQALGTVVCEIVHLDRKVVDNNVPLPRTLIKTILNYLLPKALTKSFLANLPVELGKYILASKDQWNFGGELRILGPSLSTFTVDLDAGNPATAEAPKPASSMPSINMFTRSSTGINSALSAATLIQSKRAQQLLGLSQPQVTALAELFNSRALGLFLERPRPVSVMELCRFYNLYHRSTAWHPVCNMVNRALQAIMEVNGSPDKDFSFLHFMEQRISRLVKNPVRVNMAVQRLDFGIDVDAAVDTLRELFERLARDFHKNAQKSQKHTIMREPLEVQLETLHKWHQATLKLVRAFKLRFKSASASVSASADKELFQINLNKLHYAGPLRLQVPLSLSSDSNGGSFMVELRLPKSGPQTKKTGMGKVLHILRGLAEAVLSGGDVAKSGTALQASQEMQAIIKSWQERLAEASSPRTPREKEDMSLKGLLEAPTLTDPVLGRVFIRRLHAGLQLDEKRISELLSGGMMGSGNTDVVGGLLKCFGDLFSATVATQHPPEGAPEGEEPKVMLTLQSNDVTVVRADVDSLQFQSGISPKTATRLAQVVLMTIAHQFWHLTPKKVSLMNRIFQHMHEYLSKDVLDCFMCFAMAGQVQDGKIHITVKGDPTKSNNTSADSLQYPLHFVNDMNLGTIMESIKILVWEQ